MLGDAVERVPHQLGGRERTTTHQGEQFLRDVKAAALDSSLTERQIAVYAEILTLGRAQGHFVLQDPPRLIAANFVAMEDGYQMEVLAGRRTRAEVIAALSSYARAVTGHDPGATPGSATGHEAS
ncbi:hypothetical protein [Streptomyces sp. NPDC058326]|uniref:hypothetical protein n=1 Tax=Streptomyces sp. NPDC058326 TaxID=3346447 RepID=UPI0036EA12B4